LEEEGVSDWRRRESAIERRESVIERRESAIARRRVSD